MAGNSKPRLGLWAWADHNLANNIQSTAVRCDDPAMPQYRDRIERQGMCLLSPSSPATKEDN
jgi:hypothetical protein